ncbi:MAG: LysM peptidoglycan-binding domain-containing protein [Desulfobacteraceae bacterium]|nr:LysM peptidoglycan-binding domain-containing protein [Desulfobacteraceae bacterium]
MVLALALLLCNPGNSYAGETDTSVIYVVKRGDTLGGIALRYKISVKQLRRWNRLRGDKIFEGQRLELWPHSSSVCYVVRSGDTLSEIAAQCGVSLSTLRSLNHIYKDRIYPGQKIKFAKPLEKTEVVDEPFEYVVKKGDNLSTIAQRFDVGLSFLRQLNHLKHDRIYPGQRLQLRPSSLDEAVHVVRPGDTLSSIALKYRIKLSELMELNDIEGSKILVGQKLRLKTTPAHVHIVERGDALWEIARAYGMSVRELKRLNGLSSDRIYPGQELHLSVKQPVPPDVYTVKVGDYLGRIARLHQMSVSELKKVNNIRRSVIYPGEKLKVNPILRRGREWLKISEINWDNLMNSLGDIRTIKNENGPYYGRSPKAAHQRHARYFEGPCLSLRRSYRQARKLWQAFEYQVDSLGRLSETLNGWHIVLDPGHGGLDPGAVVENLDGNGKKLYVVEDEYVYDIALRVHVLLRLHGAAVTMTLLSPNHLIRHSNPPTRTFVNEKNEVYNSYQINKRNHRKNWPSGGRNGNLSYRVRIASKAFRGVPKNRRMFFSFHADIDHRSPEAPLVLYHKSRNGRRVDIPSKDFAESILPALGAGAYARGQNLSVLRNNPARVKVILELRNLAYTDHAWALRFEQLRQRDAEKVVKGVLDYVSQQS